MNAWNDHPSESTPISLKPIAIIGGGFVVAGVILFLVVRWLKGGPDELILNPVDLANAVEENCAQSADPEVCKKIKLEGNAVLHKEVALCETLSGDDKDGCIWEVAISLMDPEVCVSIINASSGALCQDGIAYDLAVASGDPLFCDKIKDTSKAAGCRNGLQPVTAQNCTALQKDPALCHMLSVSEQAKQKQDRRLCDTLSGDDRTSCQEQVLIDDADFDGLSTSQEIDVYGSNPDSADTDADGYQDGAEVEAGYDPAGPDKLST